MTLLNSTKLHQEQHFLSWAGDIADTLLLASVKGSESLSSTFRYELSSLTTAQEHEVDRWRGEGVAFRIGDGKDNLPQRYVHGIVTHIHFIQKKTKESECVLTLEPSLALLKMGRMMRVWQKISVPDLVSTLLKEHGIDQLELLLDTSQYPEREFCIQYRESAFAFIERLLAEEGIYYFFRHQASGHTMVLTDHYVHHRAVDGEKLYWHHQIKVLNGKGISNWETETSLLPAGVEMQGYDMSKVEPVNARQNVSGINSYSNVVLFTDITPEHDHRRVLRQAANVMDAYEANIRHFSATIDAHWLCCGEKFTLTGHPSGEKSYSIRTLNIYASNNFTLNGGRYDGQLQAICNDARWHPPGLFSPPEIPGVLTATVVGPQSEEIYTDQYGRIKIQFPWDRENKNNDASSCWVRVSQPWTGNKFGVQFIPRVGSEVLVSFIQGHPNFPIVIGTVFNGQTPPPFINTETGEKQESGFLTRSTTHGGIEEGHRLSFNDKKGEERLTVVAQKDLSLTVKNDMTSTIAANRHVELTKGSDYLLLKQGDMNTMLEKGNWKQNVTGNLSTAIKNGGYNLEVFDGSGKLWTAQKLTLESMQSIELKVGSNKICLSPAGISINGITIDIEGKATAELKSAMTTISGSGMTQISGGIINIG